MADKIFENKADRNLAEKVEEKRGFKELYRDFKDAFSNFIPKLFVLIIF